MADNNSSPVDVDAINDIVTDGKITDPNNMSLETLILLINTERLKYLHEKSHKEFSELKKRQDQVTQLHNLIKKINAKTSDDGKFDCSKDPEMKDLIAKAKELGVDVKDGKFAYNKDERDRLIDNIRMTVEDLNVMNDMQLQTINRLTNERYESYQFARNILKPLHEAKLQSAKNIAGR